MFQRQRWRQLRRDDLDASATWLTVPAPSLQITVTVEASGDYLEHRHRQRQRRSTLTRTNNEDDAVTGPTAVADLAVVKEVDNADTPGGRAGRCSRSAVTNNGPSDATGVEVNDVLPDGYTYVSATTAAAATTGRPGLSATWLTVPAPSLQITVTVEASGDYQNIAIVSGNEDRP